MANDADRVVSALTRIVADEQRTLNVVDALLAVAKAIDRNTAELSAISYVLCAGRVLVEQRDPS